MRQNIDAVRKEYKDVFKKSDILIPIDGGLVSDYQDCKKLRLHKRPYVMWLPLNQTMKLETSIKINLENKDEQYPSSIKRTRLNDLRAYNVVNQCLTQHKSLP